MMSHNHRVGIYTRNIFSKKKFLSSKSFFKLDLTVPVLEELFKKAFSNTYWNEMDNFDLTF